MSCPEYGVLSEFYDRVIPYRDRPDVGFYVDLAKASHGPVLEIGSGTGRLLLPIARAGVEVVGLDLSRPMLDQCRQRLASESPGVRARVTLVEGDMRDFAIEEGGVPRAFPLVTIPFRAFQHLMTVDAQLETLACVRRHLSRDGRLVLDLFDPSPRFLADDPATRPPVVEPAFALPDGRRVERSSRLVSRDLANQLIVSELSYLIVRPNGLSMVHRDRFALRYLFRFEAEHLLARAGFEVMDLFGGYDGERVGTYDPGDLVFIARHARL